MTPRPASIAPAPAAALDTARVRAALDAWLVARSRPERFADVQVRRVFYLPGGECSIVYHTVIRCGGSTAEQTLTARVCDATAGERWAGKTERKGRNGKFVVPEWGAPGYHLPDLGLFVWMFPNDPYLKSLSLHAQQPPTGIVRAIAGSAGPAGAAGADAAEPVDATRTVVRYIPGKRCVFRYAVERAAGARTLYAKIYEQAALARDAHAILEALWRAGQADSVLLRVPRPLACDAGAWTTYQAELLGTPMAEHAGAVTASDAAAIGRALARMHQLRLPVQGTLRLEDESSKTAARAAAVAAAHPAFAPRVAALVLGLSDALPRLPRLPLVPSHGTFKLAHLLRDGNRVGLVDFDSFVQADPLYDVANFTADLHYLEAAGKLPDGRATRIAAALYDAWSAGVPWGRRNAVLAWYVASLLLRKQAMKCVKHVHAGAAAKIDRVLVVATRLAEEAR